MIGNIVTTHMLDKVAASFGEKCYEVPVGFKYISAKMNETNAVIGGESSGGLTARGHINGKDGIYAAVLLIEIYRVLMENKQLPGFTIPVEKVSYLDGCKVYFKNGGWIIARFSGTEPLLRIFCEMPEQQDAIHLCEQYEEFLSLN